MLRFLRPLDCSEQTLQGACMRACVQGERVISISELLASCPPDLIWEEDEDGQVL